MKRLVSCLLIAAFLVGGSPGCFRAPEDENQAQARLEFLVHSACGGKIDYDEEDPNRPMISLSFEGTQVLNAAMRDVAKVKSLQTLNLSATLISSAGLSFLQDLPHLQTLYLRSTRFSTPALAPVGALSSLQLLDLSHNPATTDADLKHLHGLQNLRVLNLTGTAVTEAGVEEFVRIRPSVEIMR